MNRQDEIIEIENRIEFYFRNLDEDISFTESQIQNFHLDLQRLNRFDTNRTNLKCTLILCVGVIMITILYFKYS